MYSQCMPRAHLHDLWTNTCGLVGVAHAFGLVGHACAAKCEKCEKEGKAYALRWKSSRMRARFRTAQNAKIWSFLKTTMRFICFARRCCSLSYLSFSTRTFTLCLLLRFRARLLALSSSLPSQLLPFWHRDNETASAATVLRTINLRKCIQFFVNRMF